MSPFDAFLTSLNCWHWLGFGVLLMIVELLGCAGFLFWLGLSALALGVILGVFPTLPWAFQFVLFGLGSVLSSVLWWQHLKKQPGRTENVNLNRRSQQYVGRVFTLEQALINGRGYIKVDDSQWRIEGDEMPVGTRIKVIDVDGVILKVEKHQD